MSTNAKPYKDTLNLPATRFEMKANLTAREPQIQARWREADLYGQIRRARDGRERKALHDGPPYANGEIHMGHLLNKVLKDIVVRSLTMRGFDSPYVPGWDCHGLPIEHKVVKDLGPRAATMGHAQVRELCRKDALKWVALQRTQFRRLGIEGDWDNPYLTLDPRYEAGILDVLADLLDGGYVFRQLKPIHWCMTDRTALAEAELEYRDETSPSIYVNFPIVSGVPASWGEGPWHAMIWTTTPWTLPANVAIAAHPDLQYAGIRYEDPATGQPVHTIVAADLVAKVMALRGVARFAEVGRVSGRDLEHAEYRHPFIHRISPIVLAPYVSVEDGTGLVHTAPGHGAEDYQTGRAYEPADPQPRRRLGPVHRRGPRGVEGPGGVRGESEGRRDAAGIGPPVPRVQLLAQLSPLLAVQEAGDLPRDRAVVRRRRSQRPPRPDPQADRRGAVAARLGQVADRGDGLAAPRLVHQPAKVVGRADPRARVHRLRVAAPDGRHGPPLPRPLPQGGGRRLVHLAGRGAAPPAAICPNCGGIDFRKEGDILDVWFESGSSHRAVLDEPSYGLGGTPAFMYLEGSDQHRGWFQSSILTAVGATGRAPFETVLTHGFVVDEKGEKMSKSVGNTISAVKATEQYGADVLRLYAASMDYADDVRMSERGIKEMSEAYRKIRNTFRYLLGNLGDYATFDPGAVPPETLHEIDRWALGQLNKLIRDVRASYERFEFYRVYQRIYQFCAVDLSSFYLDVLKDRLYAELPDGPDRRAAQFVLAKLHDDLTRLLAPIIPHTAEELWDFLPKSSDRPTSVHLAEWPEPDPAWDDDERDSRWVILRTLRDGASRSYGISKKWETNR